MAGIISAANLGGVADPRLGDEADIIGVEEEHHVTIEKPSSDALHTIPAPIFHGKGSIYMDHTISFENYLFWAERSRNVEKHIRTDDKGLQQLGNILIGRKIKPDPPQPALENEKTAEKAVSEKQPVPQDEQTSEKAGSENQGPPAYEATDGKVDKYGITETEWEQAQRAARTATWGE